MGRGTLASSNQWLIRIYTSYATEHYILMDGNARIPFQWRFDKIRRQLFPISGLFYRSAIKFNIRSLASRDINYKSWHNYQSVYVCNKSRFRIRVIIEERFQQKIWLLFQLWINLNTLQKSLFILYSYQ